ncbi:MAG TPA: N-acetylmuramoyl-L-alanine amidase [Actinomycetota bacterium]|nr:N-acetylmuramoyl-L-alanine amidase [Actinomycetota bacterium]
MTSGPARRDAGIEGLIRQGDRSQQVADVQARLRALGLAVDDEAGVFGDSTRHAVRTFQQTRGVLVDGIVGPNTWTELVEASWRLGDRSLYLKVPPFRGDDVSLLQKRLNALGFDSGREDGIFGEDTARGVKEFQKEYGVAEDGIWGPRSQSALAGLRVDRPGTTAQLREELRRSPDLHGALVVLDPGHGGSDPGARAAAGLLEADVAWDLAVRLADKLSGMGARVRFTRTEAEAPDASERARRANEVAGDVFLSLHLNEHEEPTAEGASTYYFHTSAAGRSLAESIQEGLVALGVRDCRSHACSYTVLRETRMPAVLVEPVFVSNPDEAKRLEEADFRAALADAIATGVSRYYASTPV